MIRGIIFDFGGVLMENATEKRYKQCSKFCSEDPTVVERKIKIL